MVRISILAPLTGRDVQRIKNRTFSSPFQSSRPLRGATLLQRPQILCRQISILAPLTGRDLLLYPSIHPHKDFNPRAPYGARLLLYPSIHPHKDFNPRAPYGARLPRKTTEMAMPIAFQSSRPLRGATSKSINVTYRSISISILAPLTGRDSKNTQKSRVFLQ